MGKFIKLKFIKIIILHCMVGVLFAFFYIHLTIPEFKEFKLKRMNIEDKVEFVLPFTDTFLLKIWYKEIPLRVYFNSLPIVHSFYRNRKNTNELYYLLTPEFARMGLNRIEIISDNTSDIEKRYNMRIKNNLGVSDIGVLLLKPAKIAAIKDSLSVYAFSILLFIILGLVISFLCARFFGIPFDAILFKYILLYLPFFLFLLFIYIIQQFIPFEIYFFKQGFYGIFLFFVLVIQLPVLVMFLLRALRGKFSSLSEVPKMMTEHLVGLTAVRWWISRDFAQKCIYIFIFLISLCCLFFILKISFLINILSNLAYIFLFAGFVKIFIEAQKKSRHSSESDA